MQYCFKLVLHYLHLVESMSVWVRSFWMLLGTSVHASLLCRVHVVGTVVHPDICPAVPFLANSYAP